MRVVSGGIGGVEPLQNVVAQEDRVGEILEGQGVIGQARDRQGARDRAEGDDELLVVDGDVAFERLDLDALPLEVELGGVPEHELGVRAHHA